MIFSLELIDILIIELVAFRINSFNLIIVLAKSFKIKIIELK